MEKASTITYLKGETTATELEGRESERPAQPSESTIPFPIWGKISPNTYKQAAQSTFSHRLPFQISGLHEKTKRGKAKMKTKGNKQKRTRSKTKPPQILLLHKAWGQKLRVQDPF